MSALADPGASQTVPGISFAVCLEQDDMLQDKIGMLRGSRLSAVCAETGHVTACSCA